MGHRARFATNRQKCASRLPLRRQPRQPLCPDETERLLLPSRRRCTWRPARGDFCLVFCAGSVPLIRYLGVLPSTILHLARALHWENPRRFFSGRGRHSVHLRVVTAITAAALRGWRQSRHDPSTAPNTQLVHSTLDILLAQATEPCC